MEIPTSPVNEVHLLGFFIIAAGVAPPKACAVRTVYFVLLMRRQFLSVCKGWFSFGTECQSHST